MKAFSRKLVASSLFFLVSIATSSCSSLSQNNSNDMSPEWYAGYDSQDQISAAPIEDYAEAFAYCTTIQESLFPTEDSRESTDFTEGCLEYVYQPGVTEEDPEQQNSEEVEADLLSRLNSAGETEWSVDPFANSTASEAETVYLGNGISDNSVCAVWVFENKAKAVEAGESGFFNFVQGQYWWGDESSGKGIVFVVDYPDSVCAQDGANALNWLLE